MAKDENKLSKSELEDLLNEIERDRQPSPKRKPNQKKKSKVRIDMIIAAVLAVVVVVGAALLIWHLVKNTPSEAEKAVAENPLEDEKYPEISDVVKNYLNAFLIEDDEKRAETIAQYVGNLYDINSVKPKTHYVSGYSAVECYTKEGPYENTYVVYAYYQMGIKNIETTVPSIEILYVVRDTKTGNVYIQNDSGEDIQKYIRKVTEDSDVQQLLQDVDEEFEQAKNADPKLKKYFDDMNAAADKAKETTSATSTEKEQQTTKKTNPTKKATTKKTTKSNSKKK